MNRKGALADCCLGFNGVLVGGGEVATSGEGFQVFPNIIKATVLGRNP